MDGIPFVAEGRLQSAIAGLRIAVQEVWGRETLVAYNSDLGGSC